MKNSSSIKKILIRTKKQIFGQNIGSNSSRFHGEGFEFSKLREYQYGDDIRKIDWKTSAKVGKPYVKLYNEERELNIYVIVLATGSLMFGRKILKSTLVANIVSLLGYATIKNSDKFNFAIFSQKVDFTILKTKNIHSVEAALKKIGEFDFIGTRVDYIELEKYLTLLPKGIVFLIGDFVSENIQFKGSAKKHEIILLGTRDEFEEKPLEIGQLNIVDPIFGDRIYFDFNFSEIEKYVAQFKELDANNIKNFSKKGVSWQKIYTHEDPFYKLINIFSR